jgi:uncharacterized protein (TIGR03663 family)
LEKQVGTASTKQRNRKRKSDDWGATKSETPSDRAALTPEAARPAAETPSDTGELPPRAWLILSVVILAAAAFLRFYDLDLKPMHHDEGVNGFFLTSLVRQGIYKYDPTNYHGPTLYYLSLPPVALFGLSTFAVRFLTAAFGVATVWLVLCLRRQLGTVAALAAAALVAVSPGAVYYSRYFIHETLFVFFTLGVVVAAVRFYETASAWHLMLLALSAGLLCATKETHFVSVITLLLAWLVAWGWSRGRGPERPAAAAGRRRSARPAPRAESGYRALVSKLGGPNAAAFYAVWALALFVIVNGLFYSSFLTNWQGLNDAFKALDVWSDTGTSDFHKKPVYTYANWLWQEEAPILILAAVGSAVALFGRARHRVAVFAGAWGFGVLAAYSLIPYKTPWLALNFVIPLALAAGYAVQALGRLPLERLLLFVAAALVGSGVLYWLSEAAWLATQGRQAAAVFTLVAGLTALGASLVLDAEGRGAGWPRRAAQACAVLLLACAVGAFQTYRLNFEHYDDDRYPYVYSHSKRGMLQLVGEIERLAERTGRGKETAINIASRDYWPLPWYFRDYKGVGYHGSAAASYDPQSTPIVVGREDGQPADADYIGKLRPLLKAEYEEVGTYELRPGVRLVLFARRDLVRG